MRVFCKIKVPFYFCPSCSLPLWLPSQSLHSRRSVLSRWMLGKLQGTGQRSQVRGLPALRLSRQVYPRLPSRYLQVRGVALRELLLLSNAAQWMQNFQGDGVLWSRHPQRGMYVWVPLRIHRQLYQVRAQQNVQPCHRTKLSDWAAVYGIKFEL